VRRKGRDHRAAAGKRSHLPARVLHPRAAALATAAAAACVHARRRVGGAGLAGGPRAHTRLAGGGGRACPCSVAGRGRALGLHTPSAYPLAARFPCATHPCVLAAMRRGILVTQAARAGVGLGVGVCMHACGRQALPTPPGSFWVLKPPEGCPTGKVYGQLGLSPGQVRRPPPCLPRSALPCLVRRCLLVLGRLSFAVCLLVAKAWRGTLMADGAPRREQELPGPDPAELRDKLLAGGLSQDVCVNDLEPPAHAVVPVLADIKQARPPCLPPSSRLLPPEIERRCASALAGDGARQRACRRAGCCRAGQATCLPAR
jgi:hypothetical protein